MLKVSRVIIENFRGIRSASILLGEHSVLVGANNCGKTAFIEAIALALGRERMLSRIGDFDFHEGFYAVEDPLTKTFKIKIVLTGFDGNEPTRHVNWFNLKTGTTAAWWDGVSGQKITDSELGIAQDLPLAVEIGCIGYYDPDEADYRISRYFVGQADIDPITNDGVSEVPAALLRTLGIYLLPSRRVWDDALTFSASSFTKVLREQGAIPDDVIRELRIALAQSAKPEGKTEPTKFGEIIGGVQRRLQEFGLLKANEERIRYRPTTLDLRGLLESLTPQVERNDCWTPLAAQGDGVIAVQNLLLLLELANRRRSRGEGAILLLEEPELHLHPSVQQQIVGLCRAAAQQTIVSTHSPYVAAAYSPRNVLVLRNAQNSLTAQPLLPTSNNETKNLIKRYSHQEKLDFLSAVMASVVLVPEGESEADWLRWLIGLADLMPEQKDAPRLQMKVFTVLRTKSGRITDSIHELRRLGAEVFTINDGDKAGIELSRLAVAAGVKCALRWPADHEIEHIASGIIEPALSQLSKERGFGGVSSKDQIAGRLLGAKSDSELKQRFMDVAFEHTECAARARKVVDALRAACAGQANLSGHWAAVDQVYVYSAV